MKFNYQSENVDSDEEGDFGVISSSFLVEKDELKDLSLWLSRININYAVTKFISDGQKKYCVVVQEEEDEEDVDEEVDSKFNMDVLKKGNSQLAKSPPQPPAKSKSLSSDTEKKTTSRRKKKEDETVSSTTVSN